jgi:hypothetical protein
MSISLQPAPLGSGPFASYELQKFCVIAKHAFFMRAVLTVFA